MEREKGKLMALEEQNKELQFRVEELKKNFLTLKVEMDIQQEHMKRIIELNKLLVPKLDIENIANSFFTYLKEVLGYDQCGIIVKDEKYFFLNDVQENKLEFQKTLKDEETSKVITYLYEQLKENKKPVILDKSKVNEITNNKINSLVALPLLSNDELLGLIILESAQENIYTQNELSLIIELTESMPEIIENAIHFSEINQIAIKDPVTGLYNREFFDTKMEAKYIRNKLPFSIITLDIVKLKRVNTLYGHSIGDKAIKELGKILKLFSHKKYMVSRYEGGKFLILLPCHNLDSAKEAANKIKNYLLEKNILKLDLAYAFGCASYDKQNNLTKDEILVNADNALYSAKLLGENKVVAYKTK